MHKFSIILFLLFFFTTGKVKASHAAGGELLYEHVNGNTYRVIFKFYRDCGGIKEQDSIFLCYHNSCDSFSDQAVLKKLVMIPGNLPNGGEVSVGCPGYPASCLYPASSLPGYREWWYAALVTLPTQCNYWTFSAFVGARNGTINLAPGGDIYLEATLDNSFAPVNSSPFFSVKPVPYVCNGRSFNFNNGGVDVDGDSLSFDIITPQQRGGACPFYSIPMNFKNDIPPYNTITNPFQTNNSFTFIRSTGQMSFVPGLTGAHTLALRVKEYRNQKLIGSVMRDIQVQVLACSSQPVVNYALGSFNNDSLQNGQVEACVGVPMSFCFNFASSDPATILVATDNHSVAAPGSVMTYLGGKTDSLSGCFSWTPEAKDRGLKILTVTVKDSTCKPPGISISQTFNLPVNVNLVDNLIKDTSICPGDSIRLGANNGSNFSWFSLPGGSGAGSLSCLSCRDPIARPAQPTTYIVVTNHYTYCNRNIDTAIIKFKYQPGKTEASSNSPLCEYDTLKLYAETMPGATYKWQGPGSFFDTNQNAIRTMIRCADSGWYSVKVVSDLSGCSSIGDSIYLIVGEAPVPYFALKDEVCVEEYAELIPYWDHKKVIGYQWFFENALVDTTIYKTFYIKWAESGTKKVAVIEKGKNGCYSLPYVHNILVHDLPAIEIEATTTKEICSGDSVALRANYMAGTYRWEPDKYFRTNSGNEVVADVIRSGNIIVLFTDKWGCENSDSIYINTMACCDVAFPDAFTPNGDGKNDKFRLITIGQHDIAVFMIVNRWGQVVFSTNNETQGWDGKLNGKEQENGIYYYYMKYVCSDEQVFEKKGSFTLIR